MILALDPGKDKTGIALVEEDGSLVEKKVVPTKELLQTISRWIERNPRLIVMGNGTKHKEMKQTVEELLKEMGSSLSVDLVNEKYTTEMGEAWYKRDHPAKGLARLIPSGMRSVPVPIDDYVAWIIGLIYLGIVKEEDMGHKKV